MSLTIHIAPWFWHGLVGFAIGGVIAGVVAVCVISGILEGAFRNV